MIPVRLTDCEVPGDLSHLQWVDLFQTSGFSQLESTLREGLERRKNNPPSASSTDAAGPENRSPLQHITPKVLTDLYHAINQSYNLEEIKTLCLELDVDYENLGGEGKNGKIRELISHLNRRAQLSRLIEKCRVDRPNYPW